MLTISTSNPRYRSRIPVTVTFAQTESTQVETKGLAFGNHNHAGTKGASWTNKRFKAANPNCYPLNSKKGSL
jgi:hypothetical protein